MYVTHDQVEAMTMGDRVDVEVVVDTERMHFFDPDTSMAIRG